ncbi:MAG: hypothetical protein JST82_01165 [Bacteroidetes bacterium]|nr:hypothetical protein [Bacteroidota bacterium]
MRVITPYSEYSGDTLKGNIKKITEHSLHVRLKLKSIFYPNKIKNSTETLLYNEDADTLMGKWLVQYDSNNRISEQRLYCQHDTLCNSDAYQYDAAGRVIEWSSYQYVNEMHGGYLYMMLTGIITNPLTGMFHVYSKAKYEYDNEDRVITERNESYNDMDEYGDTLISITTNKYAKGINKTEIRTVTIHIRGYADTTVAITRYQYDKKSNVTEECTYKGTLYHQDDSTKTIYKYDSHNNLVERKSYFETVNYCAHGGRQIGAMDIYAYDSLNNMISDDYCSLCRLDNGKEVNECEYHKQIKVRKAEHKLIDEKPLYEYDKQGNIIKITHIGYVMVKREIEYE